MNPWFQTLVRPQHGLLRLYAFAYAGGGATSFQTWQSRLHPAIELCALQLPGRGARYREVPYREFKPLVDRLCTEIQGQASPLPFAFFGHSLGALLAFEVARRLKELGAKQPLHLFVSGCQAPQFRGPSKGLSKLEDERLIEELRHYAGTPREILEHQELMSLLLPCIRADFALVDDYRYEETPMLDIRMAVLAGKKDKRESIDQVNGWARETRNSCRIHWFEGDHFFIIPELQSVLECIHSELGPCLGPMNGRGQN